MRLPVILLSILLAAAGAFAQAGGTITGVVSEPGGTTVAKATVQAKNAETGAVYKAVSSAQGAYTLKDLPPGRYEMTATMMGLVPVTKKDVAVAAGGAQKLDLRLNENTQLSTLGEDYRAVNADFNKHKPPEGPTPRRADGKPDFSGVWWSPNTVDPGKPEWTPWAQQVAKQRTDTNRVDSPQTHCLPGAVLRLGPIIQFVESKDFLVEISDDDYPGFHQIYLDGRQHPQDPNPAWYGHNVGRWEDDTLVVDRVAFDDRVWLDQELHPHSDKLHVIERYKRPDLGHLQIEVTVEDPKILAKPYTFKRTADLAPTETIYEFICNENNKDIPHFVTR